MEPSRDDLQTRLTALLQAEFTSALVDLETYSSANVGGALVWQGFDSLDQVARQSALWNVLRHRLDKAEQARVAPIITVTPNEWEMLTSEEADSIGAASA